MFTTAELSNGQLSYCTTFQEIITQRIQNFTSHNLSCQYYTVNTDNQNLHIPAI